MDVDKLSDAEAHALLLAKRRRDRKRKRDRAYWQTHKAKLNRKRRERYAQESLLVEMLEEGGVSDEEN